MLSGGAARLAQNALDVSRHLAILQYFGREILHFGSWGAGALSVGIIPILLLYYVVLHTTIPAAERAGLLACGAILLVQLLGYYAAFLITPYDLAWHLSYSTDRLLLQIFPLFLFVILCATLRPEALFASSAQQSSGVPNVTHD